MDVKSNPSSLQIEDGLAMIILWTALEDRRFAVEGTSKPSRNLSRNLDLKLFQSHFSKVLNSLGTDEHRPMLSLPRTAAHLTPFRF